MKPVLKANLYLVTIWNTSGGILLQALQFIFSILLARILNPEDFGLFAMIVAFTGFITIIQDMGFNMALIQNKAINATDLSSVFWFNVIISLLIASLLVLGRSSIAAFYGELQIINLIPLVALSYIISSLSMVHVSYLKRNLEFKKLKIAEITSFLIAGITGLILANLNFGVITLVYQILIHISLFSIFVWHFSKWKPELKFRFESLHKFRKVGLYLAANKTLNYWIGKLDNILIGKFLGGVNLGFYDKSYSFMLIPHKGLSGSLASVFQSYFSREQDNHDKIKELSYRLSSFTGLIIIPLLLILIINCEYFVIGFLGDQWEPIIPLLKIFALAAIPGSVFYPGTIFLSQGRTDLQFKIDLVVNIIGLILIIVALSYGLKFIAIAVGLIYALSSIIKINVAGNLINANFLKLLSPLAIQLFIASTIILAVHTVTEKLILTNHFILFCFNTIISIMAYSIISFALNAPGIKDLKNILSKMLKST